jgi:hypothetical protein
MPESSDPGAPPDAGEAIPVPRALSLSLTPTLNRFLRDLAKREDRAINKTAERLIRSGLRAEGIPFDDGASS